jgi:colanic acid biosynthesis glycosyl transferase WcaI
MSGPAGTGSRVVLGFQTEYFPPDVNANADLYGTLVEHLAPLLDAVDIVTARPHYGSRIEGSGLRHFADSVRVIRSRPPSWRHRANLAARFVSELSFAARNTFAALRASRDWDVVVASSPPLFLGVGALVVARARRIPLVWWVQDLHPEIAAALGLVAPESRPVRILHRAHDLVLRHAQVSIAISEAQRRTLLDAYPCAPPERVVVLENPATHAEAVTRCDLSCGEPVIGSDEPMIVAYTGNMGMSQGLEHVLDVAAAVRARPVRFVLHGEGAAEADLRQAAARQRLDNVEFSHFASDDEYVELLRRAHALLLCLRPGIDRYSFPSKVWTYLAAARPIVAWAGSGGAVETTIARSGAGVFAPWGDVPAAVESLVQLRDDRRRQELATAAREFAAFHASPEAHAKRLADLVRTAAAASS